MEAAAAKYTGSCFQWGARYLLLCPLNVAAHEEKLTDFMVLWHDHGDTL
jgi:hypothetical protein